MQRQRLPVSQQFPDLDKILHQNCFEGIDRRTTCLDQVLELVQRVPECSLPRIRVCDVFVAKLFTARAVCSNLGLAE
jgi:hypothetical protein